MADGVNARLERIEALLLAVLDLLAGEAEDDETGPAFTLDGEPFAGDRDQGAAL
jgi:hypothetical protein